MKSPRILLIDDDESLCTLLTMHLKDAGHSVTASTVGKDALALLESDVFNIVITDLRIDTVTGFDILNKVNSVSNNTEVIMVTGHGSVENAVDAMKQGAFNYITKPVDFLKFTETLKRLGLFIQIVNVEAISQGVVEETEKRTTNIS